MVWMQLTVQTLPAWVQMALLVIPALGSISVALGFLLSVQQSRITNAQARAAIIAGCLKGFAEDHEIQNAYYRIEYSSLIYDETFHNSTQEREVDKLLRHFANIALAWQAGLLTVRDIKPLEYYILRVTRDVEIQKYLDFVAVWSRKTSAGEHPYTVLNNLSKTLIASSDKAVRRASRGDGRQSVQESGRGQGTSSGR